MINNYLKYLYFIYVRTISDFFKQFSSYTDLSCDGDFKSDIFNLTDSHLKDFIDL